MAGAELLALGDGLALAVDGGLDPVVIGFGIPDPPPASGRRPLRERFPQIAEDDTVVLWWGSIWRWLDAATALAPIYPAWWDPAMGIPAPNEELETHE